MSAISTPQLSVIDTPQKATRMVLASIGPKYPKKVDKGNLGSTSGSCGTGWLDGLRGYTGDYKRVKNRLVELLNKSWKA